MKRPLFFPLKNAARSARLQWLFAYLTLLAIPMVLSLTIYTQALRALDGQMKNLTYGALKQTQLTVDAELEKAAALAGQYLIDKRVHAAIVADPAEPATYSSVWVVAQNAIHECAIYPIVSSIGVYFPKNDTMLTNKGSSGLETYARVYLEKHAINSVSDLGTQIDISSLRETLSQRHTGNFVRIGDAVLYLYSSPTNKKTGRTGTMSLMLNTDYIDQLLKQAEWIAAGKITVCDPSGQLFASAENGTLDSTAYVQEIVSPQTGFSYTLSTPHSAYDTSVQKAMHASIIGFILSLVAGLAASFFFTRRLGMPILRIFDKLNSSAGIQCPSQQQSIYQAMDGAINTLVAANHTQLEESTRNLRAYRERMLFAVLEGYRCSHGFLSDLCDFFSIPTSHCFYIIVRFHDVMQPFALSGSLRGRLLSNERECTLLSFAREDEYDSPEKFQSAVVSFIKENAQACVQGGIAVSYVLSAIDDLPSAGAIAASAALTAAEGEVYLCSPVVSTASQEVSFFHEFPPQETVQEIVSLVRAHDLRAAAQTICTWLERGGENTENDAAAGWEAATLTGIALQEMQSWMDRSSLEHENILSQLFLCIGRKEACAQVSRFMMKMEDTLASGRDMDITMRAITYIEREYADVNMNLDSIAQALDVSTSSLTRKFKTSVGMTVLEFIHVTRIARAKELLALPLGERPTIDETSQRVGFQNVNTFIRIFKRYTGTTPGKF